MSTTEKLPLNAPVELCQWFYNLIDNAFIKPNNEKLMYWMSICYDTGRIDGINYDKKQTLKSLLLK